MRAVNPIGPQLTCVARRHGTLDGALRCDGCGSEFGSLRVDGGPAVALLLDDARATDAAATTARIFEQLERGPPWNDEALASTDAPFLQALSIYGAAHWGPWCTPTLAAPRLEWIAELVAGAPDGPALVLGAATCGEVLQLDPARDVFALDGSAPLLGFASGLSAAPQWLPLVAAPGSYRLHRVAVPSAIQARLARTRLILGDARDPPLRPGSFALVLCVNLIDSTTHPREVLLRAQALLAPGGCLLVASPYNWDDDVTPPPRRLDPDGVRQVLSGLREVATLDDIPWPLRVHDRLRAEYRVHAMTFAKPG